jgi:hypothetical protein
MTAKPPRSFRELMSQLYEIPKDRHNRHRSDFVYRGLDVASWGLETSLRRLGSHYADVEAPLLRNFIKYAAEEDLSTKSLLYKLAVAQHHGLPTRVLDWTTAPKVALHFAVGDESRYHEDGAIWCVDVTKVRDTLPDELRHILDRERAFLFSVEMLPAITNLGEFDALKADEDFALLFEPPSLDGRIVNQAAILSIMPGATLDMKTFLERRPHLYRKIIVRKQLKWEIRDKLDQDQVNERMLFPSVDGTARWLKRYYGPGPNRLPGKAGKSGKPKAEATAFTGPMTGSGS